MIVLMSSAPANIQPPDRIDSGLPHSSSLGVGGLVVGATLVKQVHHSHPQLYFRGTLGDEAVIDPIDF
jgi:hypothetical protein